MNEIKTVGRCLSMCPEGEIDLRERENLLHPFELTAAKQAVRGFRQADRRRCVKEYSRPTVGRQDVDPAVIRPADVLVTTTNYLVESVCTLRAPWSEVYEFVFDRLRAVRQDLVIQETEGGEARQVLEHAVRFHIFSDYRLCMEAPAVFDQKINDQHTQECLKRLINLYNHNSVEPSSGPYHNSKNLGTSQSGTTQCCMSQNPGTSRDRFENPGTSQRNFENYSNSGTSQYVNSANPGTSQSGTHKSSVRDTGCSESCVKAGTRQAEFEATYLLFNLGEMDALRHYYTLCPHLRYHKDVRLAYNMSLAFLYNNWMRVFKLLARVTSPIHLCAVHRHFPAVQRRALQCMSTAYSSKNLKVPLETLTRMLWLNTDTETQELCQKLGINIVGTSVQFLKASFNMEAKNAPLGRVLQGLHATFDTPFSKIYQKLGINIVGTSVQFLKTNFNMEAKIERKQCDKMTRQLRQSTIPDILHGTTMDSLSADFSRHCQT